MSKLNEYVTAFHKKFGQPIAARPHVPDEAMVRFRLKLIAEEFFELLEAAGLKGAGNETCQSDHGPHGYEAESEFVPRDMLAEDIQSGAIDVDLPAFVDALADLMYVIEGTAIVFGVDMEPVLDEVQRANLEKTPAYVEAKDRHHKAATIKPTKPEGWVPPDIERLLIEQGWRPVTPVDFSGPDNDWKKP